MAGGSPLRRHAAVLPDKRDEADRLIHDWPACVLDGLHGGRNEGDARSGLFTLTHNRFITPMAPGADRLPAHGVTASPPRRETVAVA
jgi:hypothetical protein